jgi:hypothetical protein
MKRLPTSQEKEAPPSRRYPQFYEKAVPIALAVIGLAIALLLLVILAVALGLFPS